MQRERFDYLVEKELTDRLTTDERRELRMLLSSEDVFLQEYQLLKQYWSDKGSHSQRDHELFQSILQKIEVTPKRKVIFPAVFKNIAAAVVILFAASLTFFYIYQGGKNALTTNRNQRTITLEDGTEVILNAKSSLFYPDQFDEDIRRVRIVGEAFFRVAKEKHRPFIIETETAKLKVLGTSFNVRAYPDEQQMEASLIEGSLEVTANDAKANPVLLRPSEKLTLTNKISTKRENRATQRQAKVSKISFLSPKDSTAVETSWMVNKLAFKDVSFEELSKVLERKYDVQFVFKNDHVRDFRFTASFDKENITQMLDALQIAASFRYQIKNNTITIVD